MKRWSPWAYTDRWVEVISGLGVIALVIIMLAMSLRECDAKTKCRDNGGDVVHVNCRTVLVPYDCGKRCTIMVPHEECDWKCVGANAEDSR